jgi:aminopeptidase N
VYNKGGYVLHMLRQLMFDPKDRDRPFIAMMQEFVKEHLNRNASTEGFKRVVEKHMRASMDAARTGNMDWFFNQWVYGTAIPKYKLDYTVAEEGGKIMLKGSIAQSEVPDDFVMMVPIYLDFDGQVMRMGAARLLGNTTLPMQVELPKKPKRVLLNYFHDVLEQ